MGWKGTLRSINTEAKRVQRENERTDRQQTREEEKFQRKIQKIEEKREKVREALNNDYAAGKINKEQFTTFSERIGDITDELIVFGKAVGVTLGKRYVCGKIDKVEFENLRSAIVPHELYTEKDIVVLDIKKIQQNILDFKESCLSDEGVCQKCNKLKGLLRPLHEVDAMILCGSCLREYKKSKQYNGFTGDYIIAPLCEVSENMTLSISIRKEYL